MFASTSQVKGVNSHSNVQLNAYFTAECIYYVIMAAMTSALVLKLAAAFLKLHKPRINHPVINPTLILLFPCLTTAQAQI